MSLNQFILIFSVWVNLVLGLMIFLRNPRNPSSRAFMSLTMSASIWASGIYLTEEGPNLDINIFGNHLAFVGGYLSVMSVYVFTLYFPEKHELSVKMKQWFWAVAGVLLVFSGSNLAREVVSRPADKPEFSRGPLTWLYGLMLITLVFLSIRNLRKDMVSKSTRIQTQAKWVIFGFGSSLVLIITSAVLMPLFFSNWQTARFAPLLLMFMIIPVTYAIIRHKLFDVRIVVARSIVYLFSLITVVLIFSSSVVLISLNLFEDVNVPFGLQVVLSIGAVGLAFMFQPLTKFFDRITSKFFYRENYDVQSQLDKLSTLVVTEFQIDRLVRETVAVITRALRPNMGTVILLDEKGEFYDRFDLAQSLDIDAMESIGLLRFQTEQILITDEQDEKEFIAKSPAMIQQKRGQLYDFLMSHNVAMSIKLSSENLAVGFILLGPKLSGNIYSPKDIHYVSIAANEIAVALQNSRRFDEIQRFNETLKLEIERATGELRQSNQKLKALDEAKDEFISMASHQLRTPLTSVKGYISMMMEGDAGRVSQKQKQLLAAAFSNAQRMVYLISDLLNVSRLKTGKFLIDRREVDLVKLVQEEVNQLMPTAEAKGTIIEFHKPRQFPLLWMDENKTRQVVMNFIDNAIYYTPSNGKIAISLLADHNKIELSVKDNGIGVPLKDRHNLFSKFYRASNARKARPDGTGLGLFMAKKIIVAQGGAVLFRSTEGKGSTFGFTFPINSVTTGGVKKSTPIIAE